MLPMRFQASFLETMAEMPAKERVCPERHNLGNPLGVFRVVARRRTWPSRGLSHGAWVWEWSLDDALPRPDAYILCGLITLLASVRCHDLDDCDANSNTRFALSVSFQ
jgi:hypothetical protein